MTSASLKELRSLFLPLEAFRSRRFDTFIFLREIYVQIPGAIHRRLEEWYTADGDYGSLTVYIRQGKG
jgi:hypothetical protein